VEGGDEEEEEEEVPASSTTVSAAASPSRATAAAAARAPSSAPLTKEKLADVLREMLRRLKKLKVRGSDPRADTDSTDLRASAPLTPPSPQESIDMEKLRMVAAGLSPEEVEARSQTELQDGLAAVEEQIRESSNVDQQSVLLAQQEFMHDPLIKPLILELRSLFFGEEEVASQEALAASVPDALTLQAFLPSLSKHIAVIDQRFESIMRQAAADLPPSTSPFERNQYAEMLLMRELEGIMEDAVSASGLSKDHWQVRARALPAFTHVACTCAQGVLTRTLPSHPTPPPRRAASSSIARLRRCRRCYRRATHGRRS
jgi:hypothetical protein